MAVTKVLARDWKKFIKSGGNYYNIAGIRAFGTDPNKQDVDTSDFDSNGWTEHMVAARGLTITLDGFFMESSTATAAFLRTNLVGANNDLIYTLAVTGTAGNSVTVAYVVSGNNTPLSVAVVGNAVTVTVATDAGGLATSTANQVKAAVEGAADPTAGELVITVPTGETGAGVVTAMAASNLLGGATTGGRDPGQQLVETLARQVGPASLGTFRMITPGGTLWDFSATAEVGGPSGDVNACADWKATLNVSGQVTLT